MTNYTLFGINNCDTVRKAQKQLSTQGVDFVFHDFRKDGLSKKVIKQWLEHTDWEVLFNKRSTSWRSLKSEFEDKLNQASAIDLMLEHPTLIKRPVLASDNSVMVGYKPGDYDGLR